MRSRVLHELAALRQLRYENPNRRLKSQQQQHEDCLRSLTQSEPTEVGFVQSLLRFLTARVNFKTDKQGQCKQKQFPLRAR